MRSVLAVIFSLAATCAHAQAAPSPIDPDTFKLPEERLQLLAGNDRGALFVGADSMKRTGQSVEVLIYKVSKEGANIGGGKVVVEDVELKRFDCAANTEQSLGVAGFDAAGRNIVSLPGRDAPTPVREQTMTSLVIAAVCGKVQLPPNNIAKDRATAKVMAAQAIASYK